MCDPVTATVVAAAVVTAGGKLYAGKAAQVQGRYEQKIAQQGADAERRGARDATERGQIEERNRYRLMSQQIGEQRAAQAANGVDTNFGSALQITGDTARIGYEDVGTIAENTKREVQGFDIRASNYTMQGRASRARGNAAMVSGVIDAAGSLLSGASQVAKSKGA